MRAWILCIVLAACGTEIDLTVTSLDPPTFAWDGDPVSSVTVQRCQSDCSQTECGRVVAFEGGGSTVWGASSNPSDGGTIASPVVYGDPDQPNGQEPETLSPEEVYAVTVERVGETNGTRTKIDGSGCAVFVVEHEIVVSATEPTVAD